MENTAWEENLYLNKAKKCLQSVDGKTRHTTACFLCYFFCHYYLDARFKLCTLFAYDH